jgi:hypothetical protein
VYTLKVRVLKVALACLRSERGQALVLAALAMVAVLGFAALAIDVGYWYSQKREVQNAVDAAALAGAQELPGDYVMAESKAREYLGKNGVSSTKGDTISITFRCTSTYQSACNPSTNHWDTIVVKVERPAQAWFARVFGIQEVLIRNVLAAGCRGACGGAAYQPVDVVQILDRTGSMSDGDMDNAKDGARALLEFFQPSLQRVGLGVLPASYSWSNPCPDSESSTVWLPVNLSNDYQNPDGTLKTSSRLVSTINCLENGGYTNIGSPMAAATSELVTNGRPDMTWGIILLTDGAANVMPSYDTGYRSPTANLAASGGHNDGFESLSNPATNAYADGGGYAEDTDSGTGTSTSCGSAQKDRHIFYNYGISVPSANNIVGIEVRLDAWIDSTSGAFTRRMCVELSWDGGNTWTAAKQIATNLSTSQRTYILGGNGDTWGRTWTPSQLSDANFRVRITNVSSKSSPYIRDFRLDWAAVKVYHTPASGPCQYAADQADIAKAAGIEVFTIGYGVGEYDPLGGNTCGQDHGAWAGRSAAELLTYMATDVDHFFNAPSTADLRPLFEVIGSQLAGGSRLVQ